MTDVAESRGGVSRGRALAAHVAAATGRPFEWGRHDCALWAADWVATATGRDPAAALRGRYRTARGAIRVLRRWAAYGADEELLGDVAARLAADAGLTEIPPLRMCRGDVGLVPADPAAGLASPALAICIGAELVSPALPKGLARHRLTAATRAWRVA